MNQASVVVCSHQQAPRLRLVLRALSTQTVAPLEVIVADDASTDATSELLHEAAAWIGTELVVVRGETRRGAPATRNAGAAVARGETLVFLDGDTVPSPEHIARHIELQDAFPSAAFGPLWHTPHTEHLYDPIRGVPFEAPVPEPITRAPREDPGTLLIPERQVVEDFGAFAARARRGAYPVLGWAEAEGERLREARGHRGAWVLMSPQNLSIGRATFERLGGFDESLSFSEGWDLMIAAEQAGCPHARVARAPTYHLYHRRPLGTFAQTLLRWRALTEIAWRRSDHAIVLAQMFYASGAGDPWLPEEARIPDCDALARAIEDVRRSGLGAYRIVLAGHPAIAEVLDELARPAS
jgi:GT2 family glycosyltransferase